MNKPPDPFRERSDYAAWVRAAFVAAPSRPDARLLFDSTMAEPSALLRQTLQRAFGASQTDRYVSVFTGGNPYLTQALSQRYDVAPDWILPTTGASNGAAMVLRALVRPGEHVLVESPSFDLLPTLARSAGARVEHWRVSEDFERECDDLRARLKPDTKLVIITNPHNPSGRLLKPDQLRRLAETAATVGARLLVDEVYGDITSQLPAVRLSEHAVSVNSLSKVHGLFALRCGWIIAQPKLMSVIQSANEPLEFGASKLTHAVAALMLEQPDTLDSHWRPLAAKTFAALEAGADAMLADGTISGPRPTQACMYFPRITGVADTWSLARRLWVDHGLLVAPGELYGAPGHVRIGFGGDPQLLADGLKRLRAALLQAPSKQGDSNGA